MEFISNNVCARLPRGYIAMRRTVLYISAQCAKREKQIAPRMSAERILLPLYNHTTIVRCDSPFPSLCSRIWSARNLSRRWLSATTSCSPPSRGLSPLLPNDALDSLLKKNIISCVCVWHFCETCDKTLQLQVDVIIIDKNNKINKISSTREMIIIIFAKWIIDRLSLNLSQLILMYTYNFWELRQFRDSTEAQVAPLPLIRE